MPELAYLNGTFCPIDQAKVSIEDRGFQFADGVYEVIVFYGHRPVMLDAHLERLANSGRGIDLAVDPDRLNLRSIIEEGVRQAGFDRSMVYVQLTRGVAPRDHAHPQRSDLTVVLTFKPKPAVDAETRARGLSVMTVSDFRWTRCDIKSIALLPNVMAKNEALAKGYDDAVFIGPKGDVREATAANLFIVKSGHLVTHAQDRTILPGITRRLVLGCAKQIELPTRETRVLKEDLTASDEVFLCSTSIEILSVVRVDDQPIGDGRPGPHTTALYRQMMKQLEMSDQG